MILHLALHNVRTNRSSYMLYTITLTIATAILFVYSSFGGFAEAIDNLLVSELFEQAHEILQTLNVFIYMTFCFLVVFANAYIIRRRKREFATYLILGMPRYSLACLLLIESLLSGTVTIVAGILLGVVITQTALLVLLGLFTHISTHGIVFSVDAFLATALGFALIFVLSYACNIVLLSRTTLIRLLHAHRRSSKPLKRRLYMAIIAIIGFILLGCGHMLLWLQPHDSHMQLFDMFIVYGSMIIGTGLLCWSGSSVLLAFVLRRKWTHRGVNIVLVRNVAQRLHTSWLTTTLLSLLLTLSLGGSLPSIVSILGSEQFFARIYPADMTLEFQTSEEVQASDAYALARAFEQEMMASEKATAVASMPLWSSSAIRYKSSAETKETDGHIAGRVPTMREVLQILGINQKHDALTIDQPARVVDLSTYNAFTKVAGVKAITLKPGSAAIMLAAREEEDLAEKSFPLDSTVTLSVMDSSFEVHNGDVIIGRRTGNLPILQECLIVVPDDEMPHSMSVVGLLQNVSVKTPKLENERFFKNSMLNLAGELYRQGRGGASLSLTMIGGRDVRLFEVAGGNIITAALVSYLTLVIMLLCMSLMSFQQLMTVSEQEQTFLLLQRIGVSTREVRRLVRRQIAWFYRTPLLFAILQAASLAGAWIAGWHPSEQARNMGSLPAALCIVVVVHIVVCGVTYLATCASAHIPRMESHV